jgi:hypothetical protein
MHELLTPQLAGGFASLTLRHLDREYPNKLDHVMASHEDVKSPRALHPVFYGSFDWHSCVHGFWQLARLLKTFPAISQRGDMAAKFALRLTAENVRAEVDYMNRKDSRGFERPYGWAWLLMLAAELQDHPDADLRSRAGTLSPLAELIANRWLEFLPHAIYPIRVGTHPNFAFALTLTLEYARVLERSDLEAMIRSQARDWFLADADCQVWEPSLDDFLSPSLMEAEFMRRVLPEDEFKPWLARFLPGLMQREPSTLFHPATPTDRTDGKIAHLDGLNFSRAWCLRGIGSAFAPSDPLHATLHSAATKHLSTSLPFIATDYAGEHWLATFALLAMS